eukprot:gene3334-634_t
MTLRRSTTGNKTQVPGPHYYQAQRVNSRLKLVGEWLLPFTSQAVFQLSGAGTSGAPVTGAGPVTGVNGTGTGADWSVLVGMFSPPRPATASIRPSTAKTSFLLVNQDSDRPTLVTLTFTSGFDPSQDLSTLDESGVETAVYDAAPLMPGFQVSLLSGDALLCIVHVVSPKSIIS